MLTKAEIIFVKSLKDKRIRDEHGLFIGEGRKLVDELTRSNLAVERLYCRGENVAKEFESLLDDSKIIVISTKEMERISQLKTPTDFLAIVHKPKVGLEGLKPLEEVVLVLDEIQDPGNLGTIIRIADWFGIRHMVCSRDSADCFNPKVVQATMGALLRVKVHYTDLEELLSSYDAPVYGAFLKGENVYDSKLGENGFIVMGNEGKGISESVNKLIDRKLYIPPYPGEEVETESLNVAVATAIICSEFRRKNR